MMRLNFKKTAAIGMCCTIISASTVWAEVPPLGSASTSVINTDTGNLYENKLIKARDGIRIQVNGEWLQIDAEPFIENKSTLIPLRGVMEKLGAKVEWHPEGRSISIQTEDISIELVVNKDTAKVVRNSAGISNEEILKLEVPAKIVVGRTFIPVRFVAETLGAKVEWDQSLRAVVIKKGSSSDTIGVERSINFEIVEDEMIRANETLLKWYEDNFKEEGIYSITDENWQYVLVAAGEQPTGGHSLKIDSITEVIQGTAYVYAVLTAPDKDSFVTQALTYPNVVARFHKGSIEKVQWDLGKQ